MTIVLRETFYTDKRSLTLWPRQERRGKNISPPSTESFPPVQCNRLAQAISDHGLVEDDVEGAFAHTLEWLRPVMANHVVHNLRVRNPDLVDDIVNEAIVVILEEIRAGRVIQSIVSFARTITHHVGCARIEREARQKRIAEALESHSSRDLGYCVSAEDVYLMLEKQRIVDQRLQILERVVDDLPDENLHRTLIKLRLRGMSFPSISRLLGVSEYALHGRFQVAQEMLRSRIMAAEQTPLREQFVDWVFENVDGLTDNETNRAVLDLRVQGYSLAQVGKRLDISHNAAALRFSRIRSAVEAEDRDIPEQFPFSLG